MSGDRTTRSRKLVKLKRKPTPPPVPLEVAGGSSRQSRDWLASAALGGSAPATAGSSVVLSKLVVVWGAATLATASVVGLFVAAAMWVYEASDAAPTPSAGSTSTEMPSSPRRSNGGGSDSAGAPGNALGGSGVAGRMALVDGRAPTPGTGQTTAPGPAGRSSTCVVEVTDPARIETTLRACIQAHEGK